MKAYRYLLPGILFAWSAAVCSQSEGGDGDPLDAIVIGGAVERGAVVAAKPMRPAEF